ncbi:MAG: GNAT family N-acetyltransferase, partial [Acidimicrobiales bacterium]|nr:GNAT family N-acetyltransferase [Acidimicrobiales bacterium]
MVTVERLQVPFSDEVACDVNAFENALMAELDPETPPYPVALTKAYAEHHDPQEETEVYAARAGDGGVAGVAWMSANVVENQHLAFADFAVAPRYRRQGVGAKLLASYVAFAEKYDRSTLLLGAKLRHDAGAAFAESLGAQVGMQAHVNRLLLSDLPDGLIDGWLANDTTDYELEWVPDSDRPDTWLADLAVVTDVLVNDAPME